MAAIETKSTMTEVIQRELHDRFSRARQEDAQCFQKAQQRGQQTFTLVEQDVTSPVVIAEWIKQNIMTAPPEKLVDALLDAVAMRNPRVKKKYAD